MTKDNRTVLDLLVDEKIKVDEAERLLLALNKNADGSKDSPEMEEGNGDDSEAGAESTVATGKTKLTSRIGDLFTRIADRPAKPATSPENNHVKSSTKMLKYLYVRVINCEEHVNVRIPITILRAGLRLTSLLPKNTLAKINRHMSDHGIKLEDKNVDEMLNEVMRCAVDIQRKSGSVIQVYCE